MKAESTCRVNEKVKMANTSILTVMSMRASGIMINGLAKEDFHLEMGVPLQALLKKIRLLMEN
jgi:hypothetical protein